MGVGEMGIGKMGIGKMGVGEMDSTNCYNNTIITSSPIS